jgi:predicted acylesterase/phospholipase RssA
VSSDQAGLPQYDCLVLSGGGAKGAYGAGVAKALWVYRALRNIDTTLCLIGTSAGALNAAVLATAEADDLISFWSTATSRQVLGVWFNHPLIRGAAVAGLKKMFNTRAPYSIYPNKGLRRLLRRCIQYDGDSHPRPIIVAATNYTTARLAGFYSSPLVGKLKQYDLSLPQEDRRLQHLEAINSADQFFDALLASSAIPVVFPPVRIGDSLEMGSCRAADRNLPASWLARTHIAGTAISPKLRSQVRFNGSILTRSSQPLTQARELVTEVIAPRAANSEIRDAMPSAAPTFSGAIFT